MFIRDLPSSNEDSRPPQFEAFSGAVVVLWLSSQANEKPHVDPAPEPIAVMFIRGWLIDGLNERRANEILLLLGMEGSEGRPRGYMSG